MQGSRQARVGRRRPARAAALVATLVLVACGNDATGKANDAPGGPPESAVRLSPGCGTDRPPQPEAGDRTLDFEGEHRPYLLDLPERYDGNEPHPLVLSLHGWSIGREAHEEATGLAEQGTARGYVVVTPEGSEEPVEWNIYRDDDKADNYGLVDGLMGALEEELCLDLDRIYAAGHSEGSAFAGFLFCEEPHRFSAVVMVSAFIPPTCTPEEAAPSILAFHSMDDPLVPYEGGATPLGPEIPPALDTFDDYADSYDCDEPVVDDASVAGVERRAARGCVGEGEVTLVSLDGGGHMWPDEPVSATEVTLDFVDAAWTAS